MANAPIPFGQGIRPFFDRPAHINPPPGWPYIILPTEAGDAASAQPIAEAGIARPRLASNVVCMWPDARPKVENMRWRGKYPSVVTRMENWIRDHEIRIGVFCRVYTPRGVNHNKVVYVFGRALDGDWKVKTAGELLTVRHGKFKNVEWDDTDMEIGECWLVRCPAPTNWRDYLR